MLNAFERQFQKDIAFLRESTNRQSNDILVMQRSLTGVLQTQINTPPGAVANLLYNGEVGHSVNSWFDSAYTTDDKSKEAAHWFSHDGTISGLTLDETDARTSSTNKALKNTSHSTYARAYGRWSSINGWAELTGTKTLDTPLPSNNINANTPFVKLSCLAAKRNQYIEIPSAALMFGGIYDNTVGQQVFLSGSIGFTATLVGTPAASTVERRYKIHVLTDRGFSLLSSEITIANAPADGFFTNTKNISMSWSQTSGQLRVDIYEYIPSLAEYRLVQEVSSGFGFIHLGGSLRTVTGYPTATGTDRQAVFYTRMGEMSRLATNGVSSRWDTINFPLIIPDYDQTLTTDRQWARIGLTVAPNLYVTGCTSDGTKTITAPANVFLTEYTDDYPDLVCEIYDENDVLVILTAVNSSLSETKIEINHLVAAATGLKVRLVAGGFHGILIDKIHMGFQRDTSYAPNALDDRILQPIAAPSTGSQGIPGGGGTGGGIFCLAGWTPIKTANGQRVPINLAHRGDSWDSAAIAPNLLLKLEANFEFVRGVRAANGVYAECTDTERFVRDRTDHNGTMLSQIREGDSVLTEIDGAIFPSKIVEITPVIGKVAVYTPVLSHSRLFIGGEIRASWIQRIWNKVKFWKKVKQGGFVFHNRKPLEDLQF